MRTNKPPDQVLAFLENELNQLAESLGPVTVTRPPRQNDSEQSGGENNDLDVGFTSFNSAFEFSVVPERMRGISLQHPFGKVDRSWFVFLRR